MLRRNRAVTILSAADRRYTDNFVINRYGVPLVGVSSTNCKVQIWHPGGQPRHGGQQSLANVGHAARDRHIQLDHFRTR